MTLRAFAYRVAVNTLYIQKCSELFTLGPDTGISIQNISCFQAKATNLAWCHIDIIFTWEIVFTADKSKPIRHNFQNSVSADSAVQLLDGLFILFLNFFVFLIFFFRFRNIFGILFLSNFILRFLVFSGIPTLFVFLMFLFTLGLFVFLGLGSHYSLGLGNILTFCLILFISSQHCFYQLVFFHGRNAPQSSCFCHCLQISKCQRFILFSHTLLQ